MSTLKDVISEAIFGWGLRNDDGHNLSMDDTDEIAEYIVTRTPQPVVPEDTLRAAFIAGFRYCAVKWAGRDDLYSDVHSEKFCKGMANALKALLSAGKGGA